MVFAILGKSWAKKILTRLDHILRNQEKLMGASEDVLDKVARLETALNGLRGDFQALKEALATQVLSPEASAALETITAKFEAFDAEQ